MPGVELPQALVHVGYPRTATTALQTQLESTSGDMLYLGRFTRAGSDGRRWMVSELEACMEAVVHTDERLSDTAIDAARRIVRSSVLERGASWLFGSDERISKPPRNRTPDWRQRQARLLKRIFPDCRILITVRRQDDLLVSLYKMQLVRETREHSKQTFGDWLSAGGGSAYACWQERFDFLSYYRAFLETFGPERVHVLPYELYTNTPSALREVFGCCFSRTSVDLDYGSRVNANNVDMPIDKEIFSTVSENEKDEIIQYFRSRNKELAQASGAPLADYGYV